MCPPDPQRAHHRQMQRHHLNLSPARLLLSAALVPGRSSPVTSRLVTTLRFLVLLLRFAWSPVVIPGQVTGHTSALDLFCVLPLIPPMISVAGEIVERAVAVRCVRRFGAGLESALAYYFGFVALIHEHDWRQPRSPSHSSKRQRTEALPGCWASVKVGVRTCLTSTLRASRGATA